MTHRAAKPFSAHGMPSAFPVLAQENNNKPIKTEAQENEDDMLFEYLARLTIEKEGETEMKSTESHLEKPSYWQLVFLQSKVNGAAYTGEELPGRNWDWPKDTYLQRRLRTHKFFHPTQYSKLN